MTLRARHSGLISIQALWILFILSMLAAGLVVRTLLTIETTGRQVELTKARAIAHGIARSIEGQLAMTDSLALNYAGLGVLYDTVQIVAGTDTYLVYISPAANDPATSHTQPVDEEARLNLNTVPEFVLAGIGANATQVSQILEARSEREWPDENCSSLFAGFATGCGPFNSPADLSLMDDISVEDVIAWQPMVTVFGSGSININTASREVLDATGCPTSLVDKVMSFRSRDRKSNVHSSGLIHSIEGIIAELISAGFEVTTEEANYIRKMLNYRLLDVKSEYFSFEVICVGPGVSTAISETLHRPIGGSAKVVGMRVR